MQLGNVEDLMKKIGVKGINIKSGANKDIGSPFAPLSAEGREILQALVDNVHSQFISAVARWGAASTKAPFGGLPTGGFTQAPKPRTSA